MKLILATFFLLFAMLACSLSGKKPEVRVVTSTPTSPAPVINSTGTPQATDAAPSGESCTPRTDWPAYTVSAGDTLGTIAERTGSTLVALIQANCLDNADTIFTGQQIRVPQLPAASSSGGNSNPVSLTFNPLLRDDGGWFVLPANVPVIISWPGLPGNVTRVEFYVTPSGTNTADARTTIGVDTSLADGASATWSGIPPGIMGHVNATAYLADGTVYRESQLYQVYSE